MAADLESTRLPANEGPCSGTPFVALHGLSKRFGGVQALDGVSLDVRGGEIRCLAGENGCGKSTLIKLLSGVLRPDAGHIEIGGSAYQRLRPLQAIRLGIQVIYQDFALFPNLSVAENLTLPGWVECRRFWVNRRSVLPVAAAALATVGVQLPLDRPLGALPVAGQQLVAIARALSRRARLLVLDEPTTALTHREVEVLLGVLRRLREAGVAILFVSHKTREVLALADSVSVLRNGRVVAAGPGGDFTARSLVEALTGRTVAGSSAASRPDGSGSDSAAPRFEVVGFAVPGGCAGISLQVRAGEIVGLAGLLGAGRTAFAQGVFGLNPQARGSVRVDGRPMALGSPEKAIAAGLAYVPEDRLSEGLFLRQSVERNVVVSTLTSLGGRLRLLNPRRVRAAAEAGIRQTAVRTSTVTQPVDTLSGGNQQKVLLARWLATRARVLILNRPTAGVDVGAREEIHARLRALAGAGLAILLISDELSELAALGHRVVVMHQGRIAGEIAGDGVGEEAIAGWLDDLS